MSSESPTAQRPKSPRKLIVAILLIAGVALGIKYGKYYVIPKRFAVVEAGQLYRSGYCQPGPLRRIIREHNIRTILTLLGDEPDSPEQQKEERVVRETGVELVRIGMPGDGCAEFDLLEQAAAVIADPSRRPVLVHCHAGVNRTGASYAVYRMKYCGWDFERAMAEAEHYGYDPSENGMKEHLRRYYRERIAVAAGG
jgi:protein tyrosine/serine phosphatase